MKSKEELANLIADKLRLHKSELSKDFFSPNDQTKTRFFKIDNLLPEEIPNRVYNEFPTDISKYLFRDTFRERKFTFAKLNKHSSRLVEDLTDAFQDQVVIDVIADIVKIQDLEGDPSLYAGGLSRMDQGHFLNPHLDNSHDGDRERYRRLNLLYYVTPTITVDDGGNLELWDDNVSNPLKISSNSNRLVVMETTMRSWHSVDPVKSDISRRCVSNYYFSKSSPESYDYYHVMRIPRQSGY
jgi:Rps23 Pro-64 3,4-dihydroxylase Tpa1-like proline 4-hydroxylase